MNNKDWLEIYLKLTPEEATLIKQVIKDAKDIYAFRDSWESQTLQELKAKVVSSVVFAEQQANHVK